MRVLGFFSFLLLLSAPVLAHQYELGSLMIHHPWTRATPPGAQVGGGYLEVMNEGDADDRLVAVKSDAANVVEIHEMTMTDGVMKMRPLPDGIVVPAHGEVTLAPGGLHIMFKGLKAPFVEGDSIPATLVFEQAGEIAVQFKVEAMGTEDGGHDHGSE